MTGEIPFNPEMTEESDIEKWAKELKLIEPINASAGGLLEKAKKLEEGCVVSDEDLRIRATNQAGRYLLGVDVFKGGRDVYNSDELRLRSIVLNVLRGAYRGKITETQKTKFGPFSRNTSTEVEIKSGILGRTYQERLRSALYMAEAYGSLDPNCRHQVIVSVQEFPKDVQSYIEDKIKRD